MKKIFLKYLLSIAIVLGSLLQLVANYSQKEYTTHTADQVEFSEHTPSSNCHLRPYDSDHHSKHSKRFAEINESEELEFGEDYQTSDLDSDLFSSFYLATVFRKFSSEQIDESIQPDINFTPFRCKRHIQFEVYRI